MDLTWNTILISPLHCADSQMSLLMNSLGIACLPMDINQSLTLLLKNRLSLQIVPEQRIKDFDRQLLKAF